VSLALQRISHKRNAALPKEQRLSASRQKLNIIGVLFLGVGSLVDFAALGFAPATVISCMGSLTLVLNMILAPMLLQEKVYCRDLLVNMTVIAGTLLSVWYGPHDTPDYNFDDLMRLLKEPTFIIYQSLFAIWALALSIFWADFRRNNAETPRCFTKMELDTRRRLLRFSYPALAGSIGGMTAAYAKASIELVKTSIFGENQFTNIGTYVILGMMVSSVAIQIKFLNAGLKRYEAMYVVPVYQVFWIISGILAGMFYFHEIEGLSQRDVWLFMLGVVISITGIILHSERSADQSHESCDPEMDMIKKKDEEVEESRKVTVMLLNNKGEPALPTFELV
jgi:uncharacterized membrane protein